MSTLQKCLCRIWTGKCSEHTSKFTIFNDNWGHEIYHQSKCIPVNTGHPKCVTASQIRAQEIIRTTRKWVWAVGGVWYSKYVCDAVVWSEPSFYFIFAIKIKFYDEGKFFHFWCRHCILQGQSTLGCLLATQLRTSNFVPRLKFQNFKRFGTSLDCFQPW